MRRETAGGKQYVWESGNGGPISRHCYSTCGAIKGHRYSHEDLPIDPARKLPKYPPKYSNVMIA